MKQEDLHTVQAVAFSVIGLLTAAMLLVVLRGPEREPVFSLEALHHLVWNRGLAGVADRAGSG